MVNIKKIRIKRVYFDCSATLFSGLNTGIQRVVRNVIKRKHIMESEFGIQVIPVVGVMGVFHEVPAEVILNARPITASIGTRIRTEFDGIKRLLLKKMTWPKLILPIIILLLTGTEWVLKKIFWGIKFLRVFKTIHELGSPKIIMNPDDIIVLLDAFWQFDLSISLKTSKANRVITVMYDLVPVNHAEFVEDVNRNLFLKALPLALNSTHKFLSISQDVQSQLKSYCESHGIHGKEYDYFILGSDFSPQKLEGKNSDFQPPDEWAELFTIDLFEDKNSVWLVVGTIEPRKNHEMVLNAFDQLWNKGSNEKLLIIGRIGWKCDQLIERIQKHSELGKKLFFSWDVSDAELHYAYEHSEGLIFASFAEGFGLPLVEAMASQIKVVCSEIPIFREVGGDYPTYFNLGDPINLVKAIEYSRTLPRPNPVKWLTWDDSVRSFIGKVLQN
jgi:alpha-1,2-rhamnosyltransferase